MADQNSIVPITRDQLAKFLPDNDTIRRFEKLFLIAGSTTPANIEIILSLLQEATISAGSASATANQANALADRLEQALLLFALSPPVPPQAEQDLSALLATPQQALAIPDNLAPPIQIGTMGEQQADRVRVTGGALDGVTLGATNPGAVTATVLTSTGAAVVGALLNISGAGAGQVKFPAAQNASSDVNTLDDYEEGTYTPTAASSAGTITAYTAVGSYTKIGRQVTATFTVAISNNGTGAGRIDVSLPFLSTATYNFTGGGFESTSTATSFSGVIFPSTSTVRLFKYDGTYPGGTGFTLNMTITYFV